MPRVRQATAQDAQEAVALIISSAPDAIPLLFNQQTLQHQYFARSYMNQAFLHQHGQFGFGNH